MNNRGKYSIVFAITGLSAAKTLAYFTAPSDRAVRITRIHIGNESNATNQQLGAALRKITTLGSPTATPFTPEPISQSDQASALTGSYNVTANEPTYGNTVKQWGFGTLAGLDVNPDVTMKAGGVWGLYLRVAPSSFNCIVTIEFEEIG